VAVPWRGSEGFGGLKSQESLKMAKIIARKLLGIQPVYDIGLTQDHHFLLANGTLASNCFNKSHSTAYGYVTFQTAYLKANYPVEYMAALLTVNSGVQEKVQKYIANCQNMNITVEPPDINRSGLDFTPIGNRILFGLNAIRNLGQGAIESILTVRAEGGSFKSLGDLCDRIDQKLLNRRTLEALILSGALDVFNSNRRQLMEDLPLVTDWASSRAKDRNSGQGSLFDLMGGNTNTHNLSFEVAPQAPPVEDFPPQEKLRMEKELLGFYISDHPLKSLQSSARVLAPVGLENLVHYGESGTISAIVMLSEVKVRNTKKGDKMAMLRLEDLTAQADAVVFPKAFERLEPVLQTDARLMVWGKVDRREDSLQLIVDDAEPIEDVKIVMVQLNIQQAKDNQVLYQLKQALMEHRGEENAAKVPVVVVVQSAQHRHFIRLGVQFRVQNPENTVTALIQKSFSAYITNLLQG
jgi:DNA polymerase-3 subunit alpha